MSTQIGDNLLVIAPKPMDDRFGKWSGSEWLPFANRAEIITLVPDGMRFQSMTLTAILNGEQVDYWFVGGTANNDLVLKDYDAIRDEIVVTGVGAIGDIRDGDTFPIGYRQEEMWKKMLSKTVNPTFVNPSFVLVSNKTYLQKIGTTITTILTAQFTRGTIFQPWNNATQNFRAGASSNYVYTGQGSLNQSTANNSISHSFLVIQGSNYFACTVTYGAGPQPVNNKGANFSIPYPAGTLSAALQMEGVYPLYASQTGITQQDEQPLYSMVSANGIELNLAAESGGSKQKFWVPQAWTNVRALTSVQYFNTVSNQFDATNQIGDFTTSVVDISGVNYVLYTHNGSNRGAIKIRLTF